MKKLTANEIIDLLPKVFASQDEFEELDPISKHSPEYKALGSMKIVDSYGGSEQGVEYGFVVLFQDHGVYIKLEGYYSSYDGVEWDEDWGTEVFPKQQVITVYK